MEYIGKEFIRYEFRFIPVKGKVVNICRETYKSTGPVFGEKTHGDRRKFLAMAGY